MGFFSICIESCERRLRICGVDERRIRWFVDDDSEASDCRLFFSVDPWFSVSLAFRSSLAESCLERVAGRLRSEQELGSKVTLFRGPDADGAGFLALRHLFSMLPVVCERFLNTLKGDGPSGALVSKGRLVSSTAEGAPTTGAESKAVSSGDLGDVDGSSGTSSGFFIGNSPETGGPGGSRKAVTAVQLSARSLFIIQWSNAVLTSLLDGFVHGCIKQNFQ